jgi:pimeloyl-ACP methyl ester carboxylesterase
MLKFLNQTGGKSKSNIKCIDLMVKNETEDIHGWYFSQSPDYPTVLVSHGNAGNMSHREDLIQTLLDMKTNVCVYDYQGYGKSTGSPNEYHFYKDGEAILNYLLNDLKIPLSAIVMLGESIGSGVASYLAQKCQCSKLIILSGFSSIKDMFYHVLPQNLSFLGFIGFFVNEFPTSSFINKFKGHTLILHSKKDEIVPYDQAVKNAHNNDNYQLLEIGGTHNQPIYTDHVLDQIQKFIGLTQA